MVLILIVMIVSVMILIGIEFIWKPKVEAAAKKDLCPPHKWNWDSTGRMFCDHCNYQFTGKEE